MMLDINDTPLDEFAFTRVGGSLLTLGIYRPLHDPRQQFICTHAFPSVSSNLPRVATRPSIHSPRRILSLRIGVATALLTGCVSLSQSLAQVTVVGEKNVDNPGEFIWTVTNEGSEPIKSFEAPHYYGKLPTPPTDWTTDDMTGNIGQGDKLAPGIVRFATDRRTAMIRPGRSLSFGLRLDPRGGHYAAGTVTVGFADGSTQKIHDILCPAKPPFLQNYFPAIGLGVMFAILLGVRQILDARRKRREAGASSNPPTEAT